MSSFLSMDSFKILDSDSAPVGSTINIEQTSMNANRDLTVVIQPDGSGTDANGINWSLPIMCAFTLKA